MINIIPVIAAAYTIHRERPIEVSVVLVNIGIILAVYFLIVLCAFVRAGGAFSKRTCARKTMQNRRGSRISKSTREHTRLNGNGNGRPDICQVSQ